MKDNLINEINSLKEVIETMPLNNKKNKFKYFNYLKENKDKYQVLLNNIEKEIKTRYNKLYTEVLNTTNNDNLLKYKEDLDKVNIWNTSLEKMKLDKYIFEITHFYQDDFTSLNKDINTSLEIFNKIGIKLNAKDFTYSPYSYTYMKCFLENNKDSTKLKECFDNLYWKCPNIIFHIALSFYYLYYKYEKKINKYYNAYLKKYNVNDLKNTYRKELNNSIKINKDVLITKFIKGEYDVKDYSIDKVNSYYETLSDNKLSNDIIDKLYYSLLEYKLYLDYKYFIEDVINIYKEKDKYKNCLKLALKEIKTLEKKLFSLDRKYYFLSKNKIKNSEKLEIISLDINKILLELKTKYYELDYLKVKEKISIFNDSISYLDILELVSSYPIYARGLIKNNNELSSEEEIIKVINDLKEKILKYSYYLLDNISIMGSIDIPLVISDRYKLLNLKLSREDIESNLDSCINIIEKIQVSRKLDNLNIKYDDLEFLCKVHSLNI